MDIYNLSTQVLTEEERALLNKGLKFAPPKRLEKFHTFMDIHNYIRNVNIKRYFISNPTKEGRLVSLDVQPSYLSNASLCNPPGGMASSVRVLRDVVLRDLDKVQVKNIKMQAHLDKGLQQLGDRKDIEIRPADKGGVIVVLDKSAYVAEINNILNDQDTYVPLRRDPVSSYKSVLEKLASRGHAQGIIIKKELSKL